MFARTRTGPRTSNRCSHLLFIVLMGFAPYLVAADPSPAVIAHPSVSTQTLSREAALAIFAMHNQRWPDGQRIKVFVLEKGHSTHTAFATNVLGTYPYQLDRIWRRLVYSGTGRAPQICIDEAEMRRKVRSTPGAIGYVGTLQEEDLNVILID